MRLGIGLHTAVATLALPHVVTVVGLAWPSSFSPSVFAVAVMLLGSYQLFVRCGAIGRLLKGPRIRPSKVLATLDSDVEPATTWPNVKDGDTRS